MGVIGRSGLDVKNPQPNEDATQVVADGGEDGIGGISGGSFQIAAAEMASRFHMPITGAMAEQWRSSHLMAPNTPRFWPEMKTRCGFEASWPRYPFST